ncbi:hypothetical protein GCM10009837_82280 [Streptomyces durmitorensis]|uniref:Uncharacterized protein n=1 Tax=Streptomyces durmitorensis TaxID=319947 RepID=A0ABY4Q4G9_9ACTN|nr:hypothetical protein [Streptomyces durmitorensis]UQT61095.1 hypothetical protein M4V62_41835 [Streptomyces durmitorensis]
MPMPTATPREITFEVPTNPTQFGPDQLRPRFLLGLSMSALSQWFAAYLVPHSRMLHDHLTGCVIGMVRLDSHLPDLRFCDADWLAVSARVEASDSATYLRLSVDIHARLQAGTDPALQVATIRTDLRLLTVVDSQSLTGVPGTLPESLFALFRPEEIYRPDRKAQVLAAKPPEGKELLEPVSWKTPLCRSHCEVADQWLYSELVELLTQSRERLFLRDTTPPEVARIAVGRPVRSVTAVFRRAMYAFETCRITTRVLTGTNGGAGEGEPVIFQHSVDDPARPGACVTAWETVGATT